MPTEDPNGWHYDAELKSWIGERGGILVGLSTTSISDTLEVWRGDRTSKHHSWMYAGKDTADGLMSAVKAWVFGESGPIGDAPDGWVRTNYHPETGNLVFYRRRELLPSGSWREWEAD